MQLKHLFWSNKLEIRFYFSSIKIHTIMYTNLWEFSVNNIENHQNAPNINYITLIAITFLSASI